MCEPFHLFHSPHALEDRLLYYSINTFSELRKLFIHNIYNWEESGGERAHSKGCRAIALILRPGDMETAW